MKITRSELISAFAQSVGIETAKELIREKINAAALKDKEDYTEEEVARICGELIKEGGFIRIITQTFIVQLERKKREEQTLLLDNIETQIWYLTDIETYGVVNKACAGFLGMKKEDLEGKKVHDIVGKEEAEVCIAGNRAVFEEKKQIRSEEWVKNGKGETRLLSVIKTPKIDGNGNVEYVICTADDITERKKAEETMRESERRFRDIVENTREWIWEVDTNGKYTYASPVVEKILGYKQEEILKKSFYDLFLQEDREALKKAALEMFAEKRPFREFINPNVHKNGKIVWLSTSGVPILDEKGELLGYRGADTDITERKKAEEAMRESGIRFRELADLLPQTVFETDEKGKLTFANRNAFNAFGYTQEDFDRGLDTPHMLIPEDRSRAKENIQRVLNGESLGGIEYTAQRKDGSTFPVIIYVSHIIHENKPMGMRGIIIDITGRKRMEEELRKAGKLESIGILAGGIAHDFNNILTGVIGNISLAKMYAEPESEIFKTLKDAEVASLRAKDLTHQLLTFSRGGVPVKETASIVEIIKDTVRFTLRGSNVQCKFSIPDDLWSVEIDISQINQVIDNLIINADQAMPERGLIKVSAENITMGEERSLPLKKGKYVEITVEDGGLGISEEHLQSIFDPYFSTKQKGSGLGLAISYSIIKNHGGYITVESKLSVGTTFYIYLPASMEAIKVGKEGKEGFIPGEGRVLLMDDEEGVRNVVGRMLKVIGYEREFAKDGARAIEMYEQAKESGKPFDVVIMDLTVPGGMGGKEATPKLLSINPGVKVIVSSGYFNDPVMAHFKRHGFSGVITKPYNIVELSKILHNVITGNE